MKQVARNRRPQNKRSQKTALPPQGSGRSDQLVWLLPVVAAMAAFWPVLACDFTSWDDPFNVAKNPLLNPPTLYGLGLFWTRPFMAIYIPLTYTAWALIALVARTDAPDPQGIWLNPYIFHAANLAVHVVASVGVYLLLRRLVGRAWAACAGAVLFAVHPVQVEPVAWVAGMKDVLCGALSLVALWQYVLFAQPDDEAQTQASSRPRRLHYSAATIAYVLALLSKPSAMSLPLVALVLDRLLLKRSWRAILISLLPWFALAAPIAIVARISQPVRFAYDAGKPWMRPLFAGDALGFYAYKILFPLWLGVQYHHSPQVEIAQGRVYFLWLIPAAIAVAAWICRRRAPWFAAGAAVVVAATLPVLGLVPFQFERYSLVADHYLYVAMLGPALMLAFALRALKPSRFLAIIVTLILAVLAIRTNLQTWNWRSTEELFRHELAINPQSVVAYTSLSANELSANQPAKAEADARRAIEIQPDEAPAYGNLAVALSMQNRTSDATAAARRTCELDPDNAGAFANLAGLLASQGKVDEAMQCVNRALELDNLLPDAHRNKAVLLAGKKQYHEAVKEAEIAVRIDPADVSGQLNLAVLLDATDQRQRAIEHYQATLRLDPSSQLAKRGLAAPVVRPSAGRKPN
jgi:tetratricopeptide (TPR) repeat protein